MGCADVAAALMEHLVSDPAHGYTQGSGRWGSGGYEVIEVEGTGYSVALGDRDCSSAVISCWRLALLGTAYQGALDGATYTGNMRSVFVVSGLFEWHQMGDGYVAQRGDVYLNELSHTAMCVSAVPDMLAEFSINEMGTITGGQVGDQTGSESRVGAYYDFPWDGILAYNGGADGGVIDEEEETMADIILCNTETGVWSYWSPMTGMVGLANLDEASLLEKCGVKKLDYNDGLRWADRAADITARAQAPFDAKIAALEGAVQGLASAVGADPDEIAKAVSDAVAEKLEAIELDVKVGGSD